MADNSQKSRSILAALGPGLVVASISIGISHLVQATRAGALHGTGMLLLILLATLSKYPFYAGVVRYTAATQLSAVEGFRQQGRWALLVFVAPFLLTACTAIAAIGLFSGGILTAALGLHGSALSWGLGLIALSFLFLLFGRYHLLDQLMKALMLFLTLATVAATALALPSLDWYASVRLLPQTLDLAALTFAVGLMSWMPAPLEVAVINSLWVRSKAATLGYQPNPRATLLDFQLGYFCSFGLAVCFALMGAALMHAKGLSFEPNATAFAKQLIDLYTESLGSWSRPLIVLCAFTTMYSTLLAGMDGIGRSLATVLLRLRSAEDPSSSFEVSSRHPFYIVSLLSSVAVSTVILVFAVDSFRSIVSLGATVSVLGAPLIAALIYRMLSPERVIAAAQQPCWERYASVLCLVLLALSSATALWLQLS